MPGSSARKSDTDLLRLHLVEEAGNWELSKEEEAAAAEASFERLDRALLVPIERIAPMKDNPRQRFERLDELAASIEDRGLIQPLVVRRDPERPGYYMTIAGARRLMAANILRGHEEPDVRAKVAALPCIVADETDDSALADALAENLAREDLTRTEAMEAMLRLEQQYGWSARQIAKRTGRAFTDVAELLRVGKDEELSQLVRQEVVAPSTAGTLSGLPPSDKAQAIEEIRAGRIRTAAQARAFRSQRVGRQAKDNGAAKQKNNGQVYEFVHPSSSEEPPGGAKAHTDNSATIATDGASSVAASTAQHAAGKDRKLSPVERRAEEVRLAKEHAEALRAIIEPHPLIGWEADVRTTLDAVYEAREKLSGVRKGDDLMSVEEARSWAGKLLGELRAFRDRSRTAIDDAEVCDAVAEMRAILQDIGI